MDWKLILRFQRAFQILKFKRENVDVVNEERNEYQVTFSLSVYIFVSYYFPVADFFSSFNRFFLFPSSPLLVLAAGQFRNTCVSWSFSSPPSSAV